MGVPYNTLNDGNQMPAIGINTWNINFDDVGFVIRGATKCGYKLIDTASLNGNEHKIGKALKELLDSRQIRRSDIYIVTKLPPSANNPDYVEAAILNSLDQLQLEYIDLYLIHAPIGLMPDGKLENIKWNKDGSVCLDNSTDHIKIWKKMEDMVLKGLTKSIGLANFNHKQITKIIPHCTIIPAVLQIEYHVYLQQHTLIDYCNNLNIAVMAFAPLGSHDQVFLTNQSTGVKRKLPNLLEIPEVTAITKKYKMTAAQVLVRWVLEKNVSVIIRMTNTDKMLEIMEATKVALKDEDIAKLNTLDQGFRFVDLKFLKGCDNHPEYPF